MNRKPTFIDVFAGCGGLSLGLMRAGWTGLFAVEKDPMAFATIQSNLMGSNPRFAFDWPHWLEQKAFAVESLLDLHAEDLRKLRGKVDLLAGGPPCQGFSSAGRRVPRDPRNLLFLSYIKFVDAVRPKMILIENVPGMTYAFGVDRFGRPGRNFANELVTLLSDRFDVSSDFVSAPDFGIPQVRRRLLIVGLAKDHFADTAGARSCLDQLSSGVAAFRSKRGLRFGTSTGAAISDLEIARSGRKPSHETAGFDAIVGASPRTAFQKLMKDGHVGPIPDTRLARHSPMIVQRFEKIIHACHEAERLHVQLSSEMRDSFGLKKKATRVIDRTRPSPTITSMPDDLIHYSEPRALTVRENARLQSFPDWFAFQGKYTTGGSRRKTEVPRFTQVANAVPPLLAEAVGEVLAKALTEQPKKARKGPKAKFSSRTLRPVSA